MMTNLLVTFLILETGLVNIHGHLLNVEVECFVGGFCMGNEVVSVVSSSIAAECLVKCKETIDCEWFSHMPRSSRCEMYTGCQILSEHNCPGCLSGCKSCPDPRVNRLMVAGGYVNDMTDAVEVVNLENSGSVCLDMPKLPRALAQSMGGSINGQPVICGGLRADYSAESTCMAYIGGNWIQHSELVEARFEASMVQTLPDTLVILGGKNKETLLQSSEIYRPATNTWEPYVDLPYPVINHCTLMLNSTTLMLIGGQVDTGSITPIETAATFYHHVGKDSWIEGPSLPVRLYGMSCGKLVNANSTTVVVAGGSNGIYQSNVYFFDLKSNDWMKGPKLPKSLYRAQMIEDGYGKVVIVGGITNILLHKQVYKLDSKEGKWNIVAELTQSRMGHVLLPVNKNITLCQPRASVKTYLLQ